ncbi:MAG: bifunctional precorrin-2 dehydrogenase/sirohydrochlorin ferrochelatase [Deltaproteobacteria bacterium]|nr:bifunctional precorrin-2 dehydrogenase/sirohydrochlorin ferrochelatase [Deltaproteobacteria bacterium]
MAEVGPWPDLYPVGLKLEGTPVLVVGAGSVGGRKAARLVAAGARVTIVAPEAGEVVRALADAGKVTWHGRVFDDGDVEGAALVISAAPDREINEKVARAARGRGVWVNVADTPELCTFYLPAVVDRSPLKVAISTSGACPAYARQLRKRLDGVFDPEAGRFVELLGRMREKVKADDPDRVGEASRAFVESEAEEKWLSGDRTGARELLESLVDET